MADTKIFKLMHPGLRNWQKRECHFKKPQLCSICSWYYPYWPFWMHNWRICRNVMFNLIHRKYYSRWMSVIWYYYYLKIDTDSTSNIQKKYFEYILYILHILYILLDHKKSNQVVKITWSLWRWWWRVARPRGASWLPPACSWADRWKCQVAEYPGKVPTLHPATHTKAEIIT